MNLNLKPATISDLPALVKMLTDDELGSTREKYSEPLGQSYIDFFNTISNDPNNELIVAKLDNDNTIAGMMQLTYIPYLTYKGSWRSLIEGVRVHKDYRGQSIGKQMFEWAIEQARQKPCTIIQLTSDKKRPDAIRFYKSLGFKDSHEGFKLWF